MSDTSETSHSSAATASPLWISALLEIVKRAGKLTAGIAIALVSWEALVRFFNLPPFMLPGPIRVAEAFQKQAGFLLYHASITASETLLGFVLGVLAGSLLAVTMWLYPMVRQGLMPVILVTQSLPVFAIAPILVLWLGFGLASKVVMAVLVIFFAVTSTFFDGLRRADEGLADLARLYRLSRWKELYYFRIPAGLPALASGIRIAAVFAPIGAIVGEWVGAKGGLAFIMLQSNARMQTDVMFAALILLAIMVLLLRFVVDHLTRFLVPWQVED
ncbi:putative hydroxymethylpyrimidine transport system permease protein [Roseibium hamelinense]|uniref:Putative hydroxymethylpyrimidine transport system permease protein n=2 Tax=Roseibium hamelinense TaxID=150831 RepID=A0A562SNG4_9HYPH|nr:putative hydroxymethylpyrimidine transport system permease protein [Roseibium hamelinense]